MRTVPSCLLALALALVALVARADDFDYYVLSLSWSPQYCFETGDRLDNRLQCRSEHRYGFIVHGLWPQREGAPSPDSCAAVPPLPEATVERYLPMMPSAGLMQHEWRKHGSCSGLSAGAYLDLAENLYADISIPEPYRKPGETQRTTAQAVETAFLEANPALTPEAVVPVCRYRPGKSTYRDGPRQWLDEIRICYTKDGKPRACGAGANANCGRGEIGVRGTN